MKNTMSLKAGKVLGFAVLTALAAIGQARTIYVNVDGQNVSFEGTQPQMMTDHVMVPLRGVFEKMGATVEWNQTDQMVYARRGDTRVELRINNNEAYINGKAVSVQYPAQMMRGSTMVPIRFISESLGADVDWNDNTSTVNISTHGPNVGNGTNNRSFTLSVQPVGSVLPIKLDSAINSSDAMVGDKFSATIDTNGGNDYFGLPEGTKVEGHVNFAQAMKKDTPGVLGLSFDSLLLRDGTRVPITASLIGLDNKSVTNEDGRLVSKPDAKKDDLKYVGTGAGAGALIALVTKGNLVTDTVIGGALGYLYQQLAGKPRSSDVSLSRGMPLGVRFDREAKIRVYNN